MRCGWTHYVDVGRDSGISWKEPKTHASYRHETTTKLLNHRLPIGKHRLICLGSSRPKQHVEYNIDKSINSAFYLGIGQTQQAFRAKDPMKGIEVARIWTITRSLNRVIFTDSVQTWSIRLWYETGGRGRLDSNWRAGEFIKLFVSSDFKCMLYLDSGPVLSLLLSWRWIFERERLKKITTLLQPYHKFLS